MTKNAKIEDYGDDVIKVINVTPKGKKATRLYEQTITGTARLGREIKISPKANVTINQKGFGINFFVPTVNVSIGIGKDHTADLLMTVEAWEALKKGESIDITTTEQWNKMYNYPIRKKAAPKKKVVTKKK